MLFLEFYMLHKFYVVFRNKICAACKLKAFADSAGPKQTAPMEQSVQDLQCMPLPLFL